MGFLGTCCERNGVRRGITKREYKSHIRHKSNPLIFSSVYNEYNRLITLPSHKIYTQIGTYRAYLRERVASSSFISPAPTVSDIILDAVE